MSAAVLSRASTPQDPSSGNTASNGSSSASWTSPGAGITGGYDGDSFTLRVFIVLFCGLAIYNAVELIFMCLLTFTRRRGLYFWSLFWSSVGIIPYSLGFLLKFMNITTGQLRWLAVVLLTVGWYPMITGQSLVLWSRLHLIVYGERGDRIIFWTMWMIIVNAICLHIPTTVLTFGANGDVHVDTFEYGYNIMEKIQMVGFFLQEITLSSIYIVETLRILRISLQPRTRETMKQLIGINILIILMDLGLLGLECASLYILETLLKGVIYSIKLKLEFAILGKLVKFVGGSSVERNVLDDPRKHSIGFAVTDKSNQDQQDDVDVSDFVDLTRVQTDVTHASLHTDSVDTRRRSVRPNPRASDLDYELARFQHVDDLATLHTEASDQTQDRSSASQPDVQTKTADWAMKAS